MSETHFILYGMSASLFTGKVRAYLLHNGVPFIERGAGHPSFTQEIVPKIGRWIIPVLVTPGGEIIQDGTEIIDRLDAEGLSRQPVRPKDPTMRAVSHLFELFGAEGLLRPAMHYRWNFDADNLNFLKVNFSEAFPPGLTPQQQSAMFDQSSGRMRKAGTAFGVSDATATTIEVAYAEFLDLLEAHLSTSYFLLGGYPTLGDYGLMNGLYAHLSRDPKPAAIMKRRAPNVFAWTERMMREPRQEHRLVGAPDGIFNQVPETLSALMRFVAQDFLPELQAHTHYLERWLSEQVEPTNAPMDRSLGMVEFEWRGHTIRTAAMPYRNWMIQRLTDSVDASASSDRAQTRDLFAATGLLPLLDLRLSRRVERRDNREVWA